MLPLWAVTLILGPLFYTGYVFCSWIIGFRRHSRELLKLGEPADRRFLTGHLHTHPGFNDKLPRYFVKHCIQFPRSFCYWFGPFRPVCVIVHPDTLREVTNIASSKFTTGGGGYRLLEPWLGRGLLTGGVQDGRWFRNRRLLTPAFHFDVLKPYMKVYNDSAKKLMAKFSNHREESLDITTPITLCTLDVIMKCALSTDENIQDLGENHPYVSAVLVLGELIFTRAVKVHLYWDWVYGLTADGKKFFQLCDYVQKFALDIIKNRKRQLTQSSATPKKRYLDFLDILLSARDENDEGLTTEEIQQEVDTFMFAGHDTTASAISWILYDLAKHPEHQTLCREEVKQVLQCREDEEFVWDDTHCVPHLTRCIKESMRMHSPVPFIGRQLDKPMEFEGIHLRQNTTIDINLYALHHNPTVWGENHMEFKPERFLHENISKMSPHAFVPFSAGPRNCIGQNFAMNEIKVIIGSTLHKYTFKLDESHKVLHKPSLVMRSETGIKLYFEPLS